MNSIEKFLNQEVSIKDIDVARNIYLTSLSMFIFTAMFCSLFSVAYGNNISHTAALVNSRVEVKIHQKIEARNFVEEDLSDIRTYDYSNEPIIKINKPEVSLSASLVTAKYGESIKLSWSAKNANKCSLMQNNKEISLAVKGDINSEPVKDTTLFWLSCSNEAGSSISSYQVSIK